MLYLLSCLQEELIVTLIFFFLFVGEGGIGDGGTSLWSCISIKNQFVFLHFELQSSSAFIHQV